MASQYVLIVLVSCLLLLQNALADVLTIPPEEWHPITDLKSPKVTKIGEFAVTQHNKEAKVDLQFDAVKKGEFYQIVIRKRINPVISRTIYRLLISAKDHGIASDYNAEVYEEVVPTKTMNLTSFTKA
ncbi:hypothetical protein NE237_004732 [Protea cynaroides]|uniref:Cystatin domain-containing protein n=1 Tax=Protea cynaroides TaxID=273540 RepID=A0A9Q0KJ83_9MAGN|nr:hypothetical protein NE237_004732 [Protea cynaroides]